ncbi:uncharacterized protein LOC112503952 [Cynara cardunculus var. scolymus]|uniref:Uncharacterized protein n=1 Tax=Cynara cardunculus var. scolymus TaxID=59895 RepID=A0A124S5S1_CYNCS|nr:uncharacterized protein LOC112503952 [Cynara cardunculus var. scolymus]KVH72622.1 hypothetical protein Ccrd_025585 [Cynara cardunculus var. scolymus]
MAILSGLEIGLSFVCGCVLLGFAAELYYLLWWKKRRVDIENQSLSLSSSSSCSSNYTPTHLSSYISCWKNPNSSKHTKTHESKQDPETGLEEDVILKGLDEESVDLELMRLHNLQGPPRFLTTINEETKEELESQRSRKGSRTRSLSDVLLHLDTPQASPPLKLGLQLQNLEGFHHHGLNPLFETEIKKMRSSPPPTFKFLRDAEEKLLRRLMQLEAEKGVNSSAKMEDKDGFSVKLAKNGGIQYHHQVSAPSKVIPLASSPSNSQSN